MRRLPAVLVVVAVALVATKLAVPASDHRSPCHSAYTCPSDHHSYVWLDAAEQGWDCAKPGAPELTSADTQAIFYDGSAISVTVRAARRRRSAGSSGGP
jgi:hypothetical protein